MYGTMQEHLQQKLAEIEKAGLYKRERIIAGAFPPLTINSARPAGGIRM